jgi:hypothetical protein
MALVLSLVRAGAVAPPDPMFLVVLLLSHSTPTAINMQTVATLHQNGEAEMSCLLCAPRFPALPPDACTCGPLGTWQAYGCRTLRHLTRVVIRQAVL